MTARTITTAAELDALPVGSVVRTARGAVATRHECARGWLIAGFFGPQTLYPDTDLPAVVLHDPSAPVVPVVSDAAVEAARTAARLHSTTEPPPHENREVCCGECGEAIAYPGCTAAETAERAWRHTYRAALTAALPFLGAAPSATREDVDLTAVIGGVWDDGNGAGLDGWTGPGRGAGEVDHEAVRRRERAVRRALDAITPRTDR